MPADGFYLQYVKEGEHTGTHYSAPCHFHVRARCAEDLDPGDFVLPAVVVDIRSKVEHDVDYHVTVADLKAWQDTYGPLPKQSAVLLRTGCDSAAMKRLPATFLVPALPTPHDSPIKRHVHRLA